MSDTLDHILDSVIMDRARSAAHAGRVYLRAVRTACQDAVTSGGKIDPTRLEAEQRMVHGFAWVATQVDALDIEAGMAKLLAARVAWSNADSSLQVHGGNGYAQEYEISRVLCDARILNIFEGAAEIQANVIARGLLGRQM